MLTTEPDYILRFYFFSCTIFSSLLLHPIFKIIWPQTFSVFHQCLELPWLSNLFFLFVLLLQSGLITCLALLSSYPFGISCYHYLRIFFSFLLWWIPCCLNSPLPLSWFTFSFWWRTSQNTCLRKTHMG